MDSPFCASVYMSDEDGGAFHILIGDAPFENNFNYVCGNGGNGLQK